MPQPVALINDAGLLVGQPVPLRSPFVDLFISLCNNELIFSPNGLGSKCAAEKMINEDATEDAMQLGCGI